MTDSGDGGGVHVHADVGGAAAQSSPDGVEEDVVIGIPVEVLYIFRFFAAKRFDKLV